MITFRSYLSVGVETYLLLRQNIVGDTTRYDEEARWTMIKICKGSIDHGCMSSVEKTSSQPNTGSLEVRSVQDCNPSIFFCKSPGRLR